VGQRVFQGIRNAGWIEVVVGSMFSGKTEELIRRLNRAHIAQRKVQAFKPVIDDRYDAVQIASHGGRTLMAQAVENLVELKGLLNDDVEVIGIDEGQFLGPGLVELCEELANRGKRVVVAGLDQDWKGQPFEPMDRLMAVSESVTKVLAICMVCGNPANRSQRVVTGNDLFQVGAAEAYEARCRRHFDPNDTRTSGQWIAHSKEHHEPSG
jgi:thymidine kinase